MSAARTEQFYSITPITDEVMFSSGTALYVCGGFAQLKVGHIMNTNIISIDSEESVKDAAGKMAQHEIGSLVVTKEDEPVGIITETDLISRVLAMGRSPESTKVRTIMSKPLICGDSDMDLVEAVKLMASKGIKKLPIANVGRLVGILTITDIIAVHPCLRELIEEELKGKTPRRFMKRLGKR
ncbi:MAG: CBS domain-containing protein [archaeon]